MDIWEIALGFMDAQALLTAEHLGVFEALADGPRPADEVAEAIGLDPDPTLRLLTALCALGLLVRQADGRFANAPEADDQLVRGRPGYVGSMFKHLREDLYPLWNRFEDALREGGPQWSPRGGAAPADAGPDGAERDRTDPDGTGPAGPGSTEVPSNEERHDDPESLRAFTEGMHAISYGAAAELAPQAPELGTIDHIVDVGGGSGAFLIALAREHPSLRGTVFDLPRLEPIAREYIQEAGLQDRIDFHAGDFWNDPLPRGADAYSLGFILHDWDERGGSLILRKIADAIRPGGRLVLGEFLLHADRTGPLFVARQDLNMLVAAHGRERTAGEYRSWIGRFGFEMGRIVPSRSGKRFMLARHVGPAPDRPRKAAEEQTHGAAL